MVWQIGQLEFILDCLVDEKDRFSPKNRDGNGENALPMDVTEGGAVPRQGSTIDGASDGDSQLSLEISVSRPAEIEAALQQFVSPKVKPLHKNHTEVLTFDFDPSEMHLPPRPLKRRFPDKGADRPTVDRPSIWK